MSSKTRKLRASIKAILEPAFEQAGFTVKYPDFRRDHGDTLDVVHVQYWDRERAFIINAARFVDFDELSAHYVGPDNLPLSREKIQVGMQPALRQERFGPRKSRRFEKTVGWFKCARILDDRPALDEMMEFAASLIPQIDAWLEDGTRGPNIDPENSWRKDYPDHLRPTDT